MRIISHVTRISLFIHLLRLFCSIALLQFHYFSEALPTQPGHCVGVQTDAPQTTACEGHIQTPYVAVRAGFETGTLRTKGDDFTHKGIQVLYSDVLWPRPC